MLFLKTLIQRKYGEFMSIHSDWFLKHQAKMTVFQNEFSTVAQSFVFLLPRAVEKRKSFEEGIFLWKFIFFFRLLFQMVQNLIFLWVELFWSWFQFINHEFLCFWQYKWVLAFFLSFVSFKDFDLHWWLTWGKRFWSVHAHLVANWYLKG